MHTHFTLLLMQSEAVIPMKLFKSAQCSFHFQRNLLPKSVIFSKQSEVLFCFLCYCVCLLHLFLLHQEFSNALFIFFGCFVLSWRFSHGHHQQYTLYITSCFCPTPQSKYIITVISIRLCSLIFSYLQSQDVLDSIAPGMTFFFFAPNMTCANCFRQWQGLFL